MSDRPTREPTLERLFAERAGRLTQPRAGFEEMLAEAAVTPQQRHRWLPAGMTASHLRVSTAAAASVVVAVLALALLSVVLPTAPDRVPLEHAAPDDPPVVEVSDGEPSVAVALERFSSVNTAGLETERVSTGVEQVVGDGTGHRFEGTTHLALGPDGRVWVARDDRLFELGVRGTFTRDDGVPERVWSVAAGADGRPLLWGEAGHSILEGDDFAPATSVADLSRADAQYDQRLATTTPDGVVWAAAGNGIERIDAGERTLFTLDSMGFEWPDRYDTTRSGVATLAVVNDGSLWATFAIPVPSSETSPLGSPATDSTIVRWDGTSWERMTPTPWSVSDVRPTDPNHVAGLLPGQGTSVWVPVNTGGGRVLDPNLAHWDGQAWTAVVAPANAADVAVDTNDHVWYLVPGAKGVASLFRFDGGTWVRRDVDLGQQQQGDWTLAAAPDGTLWLHEWASGSSRMLILDPHALGFDEGV